MLESQILRKHNVSGENIDELWLDKNVMLLFMFLQTLVYGLIIGNLVSENSMSLG